MSANNNLSALLKQADKIVFKEDAKSICDQMDVLFSIASKSQLQNEESDIFEIKIRSGILRLKKLEAFDEAAFYETEILKITKNNSAKKKKNCIILYFL